MRIVPAFDKLKNGWVRFSRGAEAGTIQQFAFEGGEEAFTQGIVKAITDRAHGRADASVAAAATKGKGRVLATMVGMVDDVLGAALPDSHLQSLQDQLGAQVGCHGPADNPAAPGVEHDGQIQEPRPRWNVRNVSDPEFIGATGCEVTLDQIGGRSSPSLSLGGAGCFATADTPQIGSFHQARHPLASHMPALFCQFCVDTRGTIGAFRSLVDFLDFLGQHVVCLLSFRWEALPPGVEPAGRDSQHTAHAADRIDSLVGAHELEDLGGIESVSRANQAAAFARISRSNLSCLFSLRRRANSARSSLVKPS